MAIQDNELRDLFRAEAAEHLETLEHGLLRLEADPQDSGNVEELFRAAHSLKGASRMLEVAKVEAVAHRFEDVLGMARRDNTYLTPEVVDRLYHALDAIREFVDEAVSGQAARADVAEVVAQLTFSQPPTADAQEAGPADAPDDAAAAEEAAAEQAKPATTAPAGAVADHPQEVIADDELRQLFQAESEEHLQELEDGLLKLEQDFHDRNTLEQVFRAAHSLKGASRMLEVAKVEALAHHFEDTLGMARKGTAPLSAEKIERLYRSLDSMREFCDEAVSGVAPTANLATVLNQLVEGGPAPQQASAPPSAEPEQPADAGNPDDSESASTAGTEQGEPEPPRESAAGLIDMQAMPESDQPIKDHKAPDAPGGLKKPANTITPAEDSRPPAQTAYRIDTIRVQSQKLDALMTQAGELTVTRSGLARRVAQVEQLLSTWEDWNRDAYGVRSSTSPTGEHPTHLVEQIREYLQRDRERMERVGSLLKQLEAAVKSDDTRVDQLATQLEEGIREIRLLPLSTIFNMFPRLIRNLARELKKEVELTVHGGDTTADKRIIEEMKDPLTHIIRNAVDHGIEGPAEREQCGKPRTAELVLRAYQSGAKVFLEVRDDGRGLDAEAIRKTALKRHVATEQELAEMSDAQVRLLIFVPGFSTKEMVTDVSGRGVGLDVVRENVERLRGTIEVNSIPGAGTTFRLVFPLTLATRHVLIVKVGDYKYAVPVESVQTTRLLSRTDVFSMEGRGTIVLEGEPVTVARLGDFLEISTDAPDALQTNAQSNELACLILNVENERIGLLVDELLDEQEVVLKSHGAVLRRVRNVAGSTILETGEVCMVLNAHDLLKSIRALATRGMESLLPEEQRKPVILLAEDSIVTRTQEKRILESAGFEVVTAVDGQDAYNKLGSREFDAVVSDVEMPNLTGLEFTAKVRQDVQYKDLPIILVTSLASDADRQRGMEVGADAYLTKPGFDQSVFIETVKRFA